MVGFGNMRPKLQEKFFQETMVNNSSLENSTYFPFEINVFPLNVVFAIGGLISTFFNSVVAAAIVKAPSLRTNCNILVLNLAIANVCVALNFVAWGILGISGQQLNVAPQFFTDTVCVIITAPGILSLGASSVLVLLIGLDRVLALVFLLSYQAFPRSVYYLGVALSWGPGVILVFVAFHFSSAIDLVPACYPPTALTPESLEIWNDANIALNSLVILVYVVAIIVTKSSRAVDKRSMARQWRIMKSLALVALVYLITWATTMIEIRLLTGLNVDASVKFHGAAYGGILALLNASCDFFIYFAINHEFREVILSILGENLRLRLLCPCCCRKKSPQPVVFQRHFSLSNAAGSAARVHPTRGTRAASIAIIFNKVDEAR